MNQALAQKNYRCLHDDNQLLDVNMSVYPKLPGLSHNEINNNNK
jgi:hypothetical protein